MDKARTGVVHPSICYQMHSRVVSASSSRWSLYALFGLLAMLVVGLSLGIILSYGGDKPLPASVAFIVNDLIDSALAPGQAVVTDPQSNQFDSLAYTTAPVANTIGQRDGSGSATFVCVHYPGVCPVSSCSASGIVSTKQIRTLNTNPITAVPAPGPGIFTFPRRVLFEFVSSGIPFSGNPTFSMIWPSSGNTTIYGAALNINGVVNYLTELTSFGGPPAYVLNGAIALMSSYNVVLGGQNSSVNYVFEYDLIANLV